MDIKTFIKLPDKGYIERVAKDAETSVAYLIQLAGGHRKPSSALSKRLNEASGNLLTLAELRSDIWGEEEPLITEKRHEERRKNDRRDFSAADRKPL